MTTPSIPVIGLATTDFVPGTYLQLNFAAGPSAGTANPITLLLMGNCLASSYCATNSLVDGYVWGPNVTGFTISQESDVINAFGNGSELHRMYIQVAAVNQGTTPVYFIAVKESTGAAASAAVTFTGTATANATARAYIGNTFIDTAISTGDTPTVIAANVEAQVNSLLNAALTSSATGGVLTLTSKQKGPRGNSIRFAIRIVGSGVTTTSSAQNFANLSGGTVEDLWTNALATIAPLQFSYIASPGEDSSAEGDLGELVAQVVEQAQPITGIRQRVIGGQTGTLGTATSFCKALNTPLCDIIWQQNSNLVPGELAAYTAGMVCLAESAAVPQLNFDNLGTSPQTAALWQIPAPFDGTSTARTALVSALISGVSPVQTLPNGQSMLVSLITTYSQDPVSGNLDTRVRDHSIVTVMFLAAQLIQSMIQQSFANKQAAVDPLPGQKPPTAQVVTPSLLVSAVNKVISRMNDNGLLANLAASLAATQATLNTPTQFGVLVQLQPISLAHQFAINLNQVVFLQ
jgi:phage tail sheath gpL-like